MLIRQSYFGIGLEMGYPPCCVKAFLHDFCQETKRNYPNGPWMGTGFIPCASCAEKALVEFDAFVEQNITPRRVSPTPFPEDERDPTWLQRMLWSLQYALHDTGGWVLAGLRK